MILPSITSCRVVHDIQARLLTINDLPEGTVYNTEDVVFIVGIFT